MKRRLLSIILLVFLVISTCGYTSKVDALNKTIRVGLRNMTANSITIILNGNYTANNLVLNDGTSFNLTLKSGKIIYGGASYNELIFTPNDDTNLMKLEIGAKKYSYRGTIDFKASSSGIVPINIIDIETYLKGVVGYEMSNSYPIEALKAQAVAARNYALTAIGKHNANGYDLCDTTDCQVYRGYNSAYTNVIRAVDETKDKVLVYGDELVDAYYSASTGGYTEASGSVWSKQLPYLISKKDDMENENWPYGNQIFTTIGVESTLRSKNYLKVTDKFEKIDIDSIIRDESGRVISIDILYTNSLGVEVRRSITKEGARTFLSLPSSLYNVVYDIITDSYTFSGKGYGHGVGMSQIGAKNRANAGQTYENILAFYYDGTSIKDMNNSIKDDVIDISKTTGQGIDIGIPSINTPSNTTGTSVKVPSQKPGVPSNNITGKTTGASISVVPKANENPQSSLIQNDKNTIKPVNASLKFPRELKKGMSGDDVKSLQDALIKLKYLKITSSTKYFGPATEKSLKAFQKKEKLKESGKGDRLTLDTLSNVLLLYSVQGNNLQGVKQKTNSNQASSITPAPKTGKPSKNVQTTKSKLVVSVSKVLKKGMKGNDVKTLQTALKNLGFFSDTANGVYGPVTEAAVKAFQKVNGLACIGSADYLTLNKINQKIQIAN